jgi:hypothetical protein
VKTAQQTARKAARQDAVAALAGETEADEAITRTEAPVAVAASDVDEATADEDAADENATDEDDNAKDGNAKA